MYLFCLDFSSNNLLTEQINFGSLYDLPVLNKLLIEHQLINFADLSVEKSFLINFSNKLEFPLFDAIPIDEKNVFKEIMLVDNDSKFILFRNDVYFEIDNLNSIIQKNNEIVSLKDENGLVFCVLGSVQQLKRLCNKNISIYDVFRQMINYTSFCEEVKDGYVNHLYSIASYKKLLFDILNCKTDFKPPFVAEGVFIEGDVPEGDFSINPPVYLGKGVQVESGAVIGANTVVYDNTLISKNSLVKSSILFENVYISSACFIDGAVCCDNASIKRNSAVFSGSVIGADALIGEDMTLENNSIINKKVKFDKFSAISSMNRNSYLLNNKFQGLSPDKSALLGSAVAVVLKQPKVVVGCDYSANALSLKLAFLSGLIASGSECIDVGITFKSQMFFSLKYCDCKFAVFFSGGSGGTDIEIFNSKNELLSKSDCYNLFDFCYKGEFVFHTYNDKEYVRQIKGLKKMYIREILAFSLDDLPFVVEVVCKNKILLKTLNEIFNMCTKKTVPEKIFTIFMNEDGTNVNIKYKGEFYSQKYLKKLVFFYSKIDTNLDVFESDFYKFLWRHDSVILVMIVFNILKKTGCELDVLINSLPKFYIKSNSTKLKCNNSELAKRIGSKFMFYHKNDEFNIKCDEEYIRVKNDSDNNRVNIAVATKSLAVSEELCKSFTEFLTAL